jgi:DNA-binding CsgD family transcriptional regulator
MSFSQPRLAAYPRNMKTMKTTCVGSTPKAQSKRPLLSRQEKRTLLYVIAGLTTNEIAEQIGRSSETVKSHRESLMRKLEADNIGHAIAIAYEKGILYPGILASVQERIASTV